jgi:SpoVK/Ycf46/Vps4 family AAA+-type ATPase
MTLIQSKNNHLIEESQPTRTIDELVCSPSVKDSLLLFISEYLNADKLKPHNLKVKLRLLLYGEPGTGKTMCAEVIASILQFPFFYTKLSSLVSKYKGETGANFDRVFNSIRDKKVVLLLDEFEGVSMNRFADDSGYAQESWTIVNTILQTFDRYDGESVIIAATNYRDNVDKAILRRFDEHIYFPLPEVADIQVFMKRLCKKYNFENVNFDDSMIQSVNGLSFALIENIFVNSLKKYILQTKKLSFNQLFIDQCNKSNYQDIV